MDIASASQKTDQFKVVTGVPEVVFANWREALHGSSLPRHVRTSYEYIYPRHEKARTGSYERVL